MKHVQIIDTPTLAALRERLTDLQARFAEEYIVDLNGRQAAIRAGSKAKNPDPAASEFLSNPKVAEYVSALQLSRSQRTQIDADWVLVQSVKLYQRCANEISVYRDRKGDPILDENDNLQFVFNAAGAAKALELVGKHVGVQAFKENLSIAMGVVVIDPAAMTDEQLRALASIKTLQGPGSTE